MQVSCSNNSQPLFSIQEKEGGKWSIINENGQFILEDEFSGKATSPVNGMFYSEKSDGTHFMYSINKPDVPVGPVLKDWSYFSGDVALVVEPGKSIEIINKKGEIIAELPSQYVLALEFENGYSIISDRLGHDGLMDKNGNVLIPTEYDDIFLCSNNTVIAKRNNHYGLIM